MKKYIVLLLSFLCLVEAKSQISINDCSLYQGAPTVTQQMIDDAGYEFNKPCMILDNTFNFNGSINKAITSINSIDILPGFESGNYDPNYRMDIKIQPKADFDVAVMNYSDLNNVLKLKKFELGVQLPPSILEKVNNFVTDANVGEKINPYLEDEIRVVAEFNGSITTQWFSQPYTYIYNIEIDGFYAKDFTSVMNTTIEPANLYFDDDEYWNLGHWDEVPTNYPFRIRFAPPANGEWKGIIKIYVGSVVYESSEFSFNVVESNSEGYLRAGDNGRFLALGEKTFVPIGCNISWPETNEVFDPELDQYMKVNDNGIISTKRENYRKYYIVPRVYEKYKDVMNNLIDNGANYFRTIMYPTGTEIEWEELGNYTKRLHMAQEMDKILELAEERNAYIHWDMQIHYSFQYAAAAYGCAWTWDYEAPGGVKFCYRDLLENDNIIGNEVPVNFFSNEDAKKYYKQRLRYILARYGYSTNISAFELFSEISNVGSQLADISNFYSSGNNYEIYEDWQREMAEYVKSQYNGSVHMVTASYAGAKSVNDMTFKSPNMDIMTSNIYDFWAQSFSNGFWNDMVAKKYLNDACSGTQGDNVSYNTTCSPSSSTTTRKPMLFSETGPIQLERGPCEGNYIETNRSMWEGLFSGLAGALSWNAWYSPDNYAIFGQMKNFVADIDFDGGLWHPGAVNSDDLPQWKYNEEFANNMETNKVDLAYLRSGDGNFVIGVITNKTFNGRNTPSIAQSCIPQSIWPSYSLAESVNADFDPGIKLLGLENDKYYINYFLPTDLSTPIHSADHDGPTIPLAISIAPTEQTYILLFKARKEDHNWSDITQIAQSNSPTEMKQTNELNTNNQTANENLELEPNERSSNNITVHPIPTSDKIVVTIYNLEGPIDCYIESMDGKRINYFQMNNRTIEVELNNIEKGTYLLKFFKNGAIINTQKIMKL